VDAQKGQPDKQTEDTELMQRFFGDFEVRRNIVGLYDLLYKIDRRTNPHLYEPSNDADHG